MSAAEDFATLLVGLFSALPEDSQLVALEQFLETWEETRARAGYPWSERLHLVRRFIQTSIRGATRMKPDTALLAWNFVAHLPREERADALFELLDVMDALYVRRGREPPAWTADARERLRIGDVTLIDEPVGAAPER